MEVDQEGGHVFVGRVGVGGKPGCTALHLFNFLGITNGVWVPCRRRVLQVRSDQSLVCHRLGVHAALAQVAAQQSEDAAGFGALDVNMGVPGECVCECNSKVTVVGDCFKLNSIHVVGVRVAGASST